MTASLRYLLIGLIVLVAMTAQDPAAAKPDKVISITAERFTFSPSKIRVAKGTTIELVITSDDTDHGFRIPRANIDVAIPQRGKGEVRVRFIAREKGVYPFSVPAPAERVTI